MLFNSLEFALFLPLVFLSYWLALGKNKSAQNVLVLVASYVFYGWWDWRFLSLIIFSSSLDFWIGRVLDSTIDSRRRKCLLYVSLLGNLGILFIFKYFGFFVESLRTSLQLLGYETSFRTLNLILPIGISFYTFQTLSYTIDVYRRKIRSSKDPLAFFAYVSFFPQLVAGPIERASNLLPQFSNKREFSYKQAVDGLRQIMWGLFKKMVIADNCAIIVDHVFADYSDLNGSSLALGAFFFAFQIYGDFSGYSDIAIGTAKLFGIKLRRNFAFPYFSRDIAEFWRRWHISLSSWFRDYVYIPLGGSRGGRWMQIRNVLVIFLISGFWHGANWTFIVWGLFNALLFLPLVVSSRNRSHMDIVANGKHLPSVREFFSIFSTFTITTLLWIIFRSESLSDAILYFSGMFSLSLFALPDLFYKLQALLSLCLVVSFLAIEWYGRRDEYAIFGISRIQSKILRYACYIIVALSIMNFAQLEQNEFIYFQF